MKISFLVPTFGHPRHEQRIKSLSALGARTERIGFERPTQLGRADRSDDVSLGRIRNQSYLGRLPQMLRSLPLLRSRLARSDVAYCFGVDMLLLAKLSAPPGDSLRFAVELGDIEDIATRDSLIGASVRALYKRLISPEVLVVATAPRFIDKFLKETVGLRFVDSLVIENKVDSLRAGAPIAPNRTAEAIDSELRIGLYGLVRCRRSMGVLKRFAAERGNSTVILVRGVALESFPDFEREIQNHENLHFGGPYSVPDDLPELFSDIDLCWIAHYDVGHSWHWARSNRYYQSGYYGVPMIGQRGKDDARNLEDLAIGKVIDLSNPDIALQDLMRITGADIVSWRQNLLPLQDTFALATEHEELISRLS